MKKGTVYSNKAIFVEDFDRHQKIELKFKIEKVLFQKDTFAIVNVDVTWNDKRVLFPQNRTTILGSFLDPRIGDVFTGTGIIQHDKRYGYSVKQHLKSTLQGQRLKSSIFSVLKLMESERLRPKGFLIILVRIQFKFSKEILS